MEEDIWEVHRRKLQEAERRIFEHPGYLEHLECEALRMILADVFVVNGRDLMRLLNLASNNETIALELMQNVRPPVVRERFEAEIRRRLHNYVAGTMTLVDHTRRIMRPRTGSVVEEFNERRKEILRHPEVLFMQDLRNYTLHHSLPFLGHRFSITNVNKPDQTMESEIELSVPDLLAWDKWSASSRTFLLENGNMITLREIVLRHYQLVYALNAWLVDSMARANEEALVEVNRLIQRRNAVSSGRYEALDKDGESEEMN